MAQRQWRSDDTDPWVHSFGSGVDGAKVISSNTTFGAANEGCSGTIGGTALTLAAAGSFSNDDLVLIIQMRGSGVGVWELNKIISGAGSTSITLESDLANTYVDSGLDQAQIVTLKQYSSVVVNSSMTWSSPDWDQSKGGIVAFLCNGITTINGSISVKGGGFLKGTTISTGAYSGEGTTLIAGTDTTTNPSGTSGGGGPAGTQVGGGGGGNGTAGANDQFDRSVGGDAGGNAGLTNMIMGAGGGGWIENSGSRNVGADGSGIVLILTKDLGFGGSGSINLDGDNAVNPAWGGGGGGAGGSFLLKCETATLGTNKITGIGGTGGNGSANDGGDGGVGRNHIDYSGSFTGTTNPTIDSRLDSTISSPSSAGGGAFMYNFI